MIESNFLIYHIQLSSKDDAERECACSSLANMVLDENSLPHLLKNDLIGKLSALLCDDNINIVQSAAGTLRNITITAGHDACQRMVSKDQILGSLSSSLNLVGRAYLVYARMIE